MRRIGNSRQQLAFRTMELRFTPALARLVYLFQDLVQKIEAVSSGARSSGKNRDLCPKIRSKRRGAEIHEGRHPLPQDFDPAGNVVRCRKHPASIDLRGGSIEREPVFRREGCELLGGLMERLGLAERRVVATSERQRVCQGMRVGKLPRGTEPRAGVQRRLLWIAEKKKGEGEPHRCDG